MDYINAGCFLDALGILWDPRDRSSALRHYYADYCARQENAGNDTPSEELEMARKSSADFDFPFQYEALPLLHCSNNGTESDALACYLLGDLLYDNQPDRAIKAWEMSLQAIPAWSRFEKKAADHTRSVGPPQPRPRLRAA